MDRPGAPVAMLGPEPQRLVLKNSPGIVLPHSCVTISVPGYLGTYQQATPPPTKATCAQRSAESEKWSHVLMAGSVF